LVKEVERPGRHDLARLLGYHRIGKPSRGRLVKTISREELKAKMDRGDDFVLLEVLGEASYSRGHLPGAIRLQDTGAAAEVVPDQEAFVVAYCSNFN
jgi:rhodanese-related sulfurtransferase